MNEPTTDQVEKVTVTVPKGMEVVKPVSGRLSSDQKQAILQALKKYVAPTLGIFFAQLALGVDLKAASLVALNALYQAASSYFSKLNDDTAYLRESDTKK